MRTKTLTEPRKVRFSISDDDALKAIAEMHGTSVAAVIRSFTLAGLRRSNASNLQQLKELSHARS